MDCFSYIGGQSSLSSVIELPFLTRTSAAGSTALNTLYDEGYLIKKCQNSFDRITFKLGYQIHMKNTKVMDPSDFKRKK